MLDELDSCPRCHGQYRRERWTCHCYQCGFEWDLREAQETVLARAQRRYKSEPPDDVIWDEMFRVEHVPSPKDSAISPDGSRPPEQGDVPQGVIGTQQDLTPQQKEALVKGRLRAHFRSPDRVYPLNSSEASAIGLCYTEAATDAGEVTCALGRRTPRQQHILQLWLGPQRWSKAQIARRLGLGYTDVRREIRDALRAMVAMLWERTP